VEAAARIWGSAAKVPPTCSDRSRINDRLTPGCQGGVSPPWSEVVIVTASSAAVIWTSAWCDPEWSAAGVAWTGAR
jgi:hypothetical protein